MWKQIHTITGDILARLTVWWCMLLGQHNPEWVYGEDLKIKVCHSCNVAVDIEIKRF